MAAPRLTVGLLNWKRPDNLRRIIQAFCEQTEPVRLFLWNNAPESYRGFYVDWAVNSSVNRFCMPRWWMLRHADTEYVTSFDDDLLPGNKTFVADLLDCLDKRRCINEIVGAQGIELTKGVPSKRCRDVKRGDQADVVLGRQMALATSVLRQLSPPYDDPRWRACDDIVLSGMLRLGCPHRTHDLPMTELPAEHALCNRSEHYEEREAARRVYFAWK